MGTLRELVDRYEPHDHIYSVPGSAVRGAGTAMVGGCTRGGGDEGWAREGYTGTQAQPSQDPDLVYFWL